MGNSMGRFILVFLLCLATWSCDKPSAGNPLELSVYFTCDINGRLVPCGCFTGQYGGLTRLKTVLDASSTDGSQLRVDVGDAIAGSQDFEVIEYEFILQAFGEMKFDVLNLGQKECQLSADQLKSLLQKSPVPFVSANVLGSDGKPLTEPYRILEKSGWKIGVVGLVDPKGMSEKTGQGLTLEKMETSLSRVLPTLRSQVDMVVLLGFTDEETLIRLANEFYELDVILGGNVPQPSQNLTRANRSIIYFTTNESRALGWLRGKLRKKSDYLVTHYEIKLLADRIPQNESIRKLAEKYREKVRNTRLAIDDPERLREDQVPGVRAAAAYVGSDACLDCHQNSSHVWKESSHASAFRTLIHRKADADPKCIACHTVGFGTPSGYRREFGTKKLTDVGCESCHGPGSLHVSQRKLKEPATFTFRPLAAGDCQKCHYGEFSRPFDWDAFWPDVKHGPEPKTAQINAYEK